jgi:death-on-curing family protein
MDENFAIKLEKLVLTTHEEIQNIKTSDPDECQKYGIREEGKLNAIIVSLINKFLYANEGMIDFLSRLMFRLTNGHVFHNGNKRTALFVVSKLLHGFGIYISFSNDTKLYLTE